VAAALQLVAESDERMHVACGADRKQQDVETFSGHPSKLYDLAGPAVRADGNLHVPRRDLSCFASKEID